MKKILLNCTFLLFLFITCAIHIFCLIPQNYPEPLVPALVLFPFVYIAFHAYLSTKNLFLTKDDVNEYPKLKILDHSITIFSILSWCLIAVWFITRPR